MQQLLAITRENWVMVTQGIIPERDHFIFREFHFNLGTAGSRGFGPAGYVCRCNKSSAEFIVEAENGYRITFEMTFYGSTLPGLEVRFYRKTGNQAGSYGAMRKHTGFMGGFIDVRYPGGGTA